MSIFGKLFGNNTISKITKDTKISMIEIAEFVKNDEQNVAKLREAATNGNLNCQIFISQIALQTLEALENNPSTTPENLAQSRKYTERYTRLAAEQGDPISQVNLAQYYLKMVDVSQDTFNKEEESILKEAKYWYEQADSNGQRCLSEVISSLQFLQ